MIPPLLRLCTDLLGVTGSSDVVTMGIAFVAIVEKVKLAGAVINFTFPPCQPSPAQVSKTISYGLKNSANKPKQHPHTWFLVYEARTYELMQETRTYGLVHETRTNEPIPDAL